MIMPYKQSDAILITARSDELEVFAAITLHNAADILQTRCLQGYEIADWSPTFKTICQIIALYPSKFVRFIVQLVRFKL